MESTNKVQIYICGGAVRDTLLGRTAKDIDYIVVGSTPQEMLELGFKNVGADFPVFLDDDGAEWALARTERKTGNGYDGFETDYNPNVTLMQDLERRDLTINAMCVRYDDWREFKITKDPELVIDYFQGKEDLEAGVLRHVSDAFAEDPVRVLRVARFAARYNFEVADETMELMQRLVKEGELSFLTKERIYLELEKAMMEDNLIVFFQVLDNANAGQVVVPELFSDDVLPILVNESLDRCVLLDGSLIDRLIVLTSPRKPEAMKNMLERLKAPNDIIKTVVMSCTIVDRVMTIPFYLDCADDVVNLLNDINAWNNVERFKTVMCVFTMIDNDYLRKAAFVLLHALKTGNVAKFAMLSEKQRDTLEGAEISKAIAELRRELVKGILYE